MIIPFNLRRLFVCVGGRGRRLPVAIVLRFDRVGRREPAYGFVAHILINDFKHLIRHFVPPSPQGEGIRSRHTDQF